MQIATLVYKYHMSLEEVLGLTIPQLHILEECLIKICNAENGEEDKGKKNNSNTRAMGETIKMLKEKTGRKEFTMNEVMNPAETIKKYSKV